MPAFETIEVPLSEIEPSGINPRKSFGHIAELADAIRATGGLPVNPLVCVMDGGRARIVDGERRYRALKEIYKNQPDTPIPIITAGDYDEAAELRAALATDQKDHLTDGEKAAGIQLMLKLDVPTVDIHRLSGVTEDRVKLAKSYARDHPQMLANSKLSLEDLANAAEAGLSDEETATVLEAESPKRELRDLLYERRREEIRQKEEEICNARGLKWREDAADADEIKAMHYYATAYDDAELEKKLNKAKHLGDLLVVIGRNYCSIYCTEDESPYSSQYLEASKLAAEANDAAIALLSDVLDYLAGHWKLGGREVPDDLARGIQQLGIDTIEMSEYTGTYDQETFEGIYAKCLPGMRECIYLLSRATCEAPYRRLDWCQKVEAKPEWIDDLGALRDEAGYCQVPLTEAAEGFWAAVSDADAAISKLGGDEDAD